MKTGSIEILELYRRGKRNFHGKKISGLNLRGQNLAGVNFSDCDIRGTDFRGANLRGARFNGARAGLTGSDRVLISLLSPLLSFLCGLILGTGSDYIGSIIDNEILPKILGTVILGLSVVIYCLFIGSITLTICSITEFKWNYFLGILLMLGGAITGLLFPIAGAGSTGLDRVSLESYPAIIGGIGGSIYLASRTWKLQRDNLAFKIARRLVCQFGTRFGGADLTGADFTGTILGETDFSHSTITRTRFFGVKKFRLTRARGTVLEEKTIGELMIAGQGENKDYRGINFRGVNLYGANLRKADLSRANLSDAILAHANLEGANLAGANVMRADFSYALLTGICIEAWKIADNTILEGVDCQYIYLIEPDRSRRPETGDFAPGEFEKVALEQRKLYSEGR